MFYKIEFDFDEFNFWGGARDRIESATDNQKQKVKERIEESFYNEDPTDTEINDLVWFECDDIFNNEEQEEEF